MMNEANNEPHRCCTSPGASRNDSYATWQALMVPEGDALAELVCGKPGNFPICDVRTMRKLYWLCAEDTNEYRYAIDPVVGEELIPEDFEDRGLDPTT